MLTHINTSTILFWLRFSDEYVVKLVWLSGAHWAHVRYIHYTIFSVHKTFYICTLWHYYIPNHGQMLHKYVVYGMNERICEWLSLNYSAFKCTTHDIKKCCFFFFIVNFFFFPLDIQAVNDGIFKYKHVFMSYFQMIFSMDFILLNAITSSNNQLVQFSARLLLLPLCYCCANAKYSVENMIHNLCDNYPITCMLHKRKLWDCESHISFVVNGAALTKRSFFIIEPFFFWICVENTYYTIFISYKTFHLSTSLSGYFSVFRPCYFEILVRSCFHLVRMLVTAITA